MRLCANLRWKGFYGTRWSTREQMLADLLKGDVPYACLQTCQNWGPDDDVAVPECCQPGRGCFVPSPRDPGERPIT